MSTTTKKHNVKVANQFIHKLKQFTDKETFNKFIKLILDYKKNLEFYYFHIL